VQQHKALNPTARIQQKDIQDVQDSSSKFLLSAVLVPSGRFFDPESEYATNHVFETLRRECRRPFFFWAVKLVNNLCIYNTVNINIVLSCVYIV